MVHRYITPEIFRLVDAEVEKGVKVARRVRELMDYDIVEIVQDDNYFRFEWTTSRKVPEYFTKYLKRLIERKLLLKYWE